MASSEHPFPNEIPSRHPLPSGFQLRPDARSTTLPVTPVIPPTVANGDVITSLHENQTVAALGDLWTNEQWLAAQSLSDPTSAKGDLLARDASALARLAVGTAGQVLTVDAAAPLGVKWAAPAGGGAVSSVFTRTGAVVAVAGDYTAAQVTNAVSILGSYADPAWITSLAYAKITGAPAAGVPTSRQVIAGAGLTGGGALTADVTLTAPVMGPSGASHKAGIVPDPGAAGGAARYLREDSTWAIPSGAGGGLTDPTTTLGDLIVRGAAAPTRLGVGTNGQALLADSAAPLGVKWGAVAAGGSQTPWTSNIDAAGFTLRSVGALAIGTFNASAAIAAINIETSATTVPGLQHKDTSPTGTPGIILINDLFHAGGMLLGGSNASAVALRDVLSFYTQSGSGMPVIFAPNETERMRVTAAGNVGIGTGAPGAKTHIAFNDAATAIFGPAVLLLQNQNATVGSGCAIQSLNGGGGATSEIRFINGPGAGLHPNNGGSIAFSTCNGAGGAGLERMRITPDGNVGIGATNTAVAKLSVEATADRVLVVRGDPVTFGLPAGLLGPILAGVNSAQTAFEPVTIYGSPVILYGNVGINTTTPLDILTVLVPAAPLGTVTFINNVALGTGYSMRLRLGAYNGFIGAPQVCPYIESIAEASGFAGLGLGTHSGTATERLRITSGGNVGIGTATPGSKLSVVGLPTSSAGLTAGDIWIDVAGGRVLKIA